MNCFVLTFIPRQRCAKIADEGKKYPWGVWVVCFALGLGKVREGLHKEPRNVSHQIKHGV